MTASLIDNRRTSRVAYTTGSARKTTNAFRVSTVDNLAWLDGELFSGRRTLPVVVMAVSYQDDSPFRLDPDEIASALSGDAIVVAVVVPQLTRRLNEALGSTALAVPPGGVRVYLKGLVFNDDPGRHPRLAWHDATLASVEAFAAFARRTVGESADTEERLRRTEHQLTIARKELRIAQASARHTLTVSAEQEELPTLFSDPATQFEYELYNIYLQLTAKDQGSRESHPLVYQMGPQFLGSLRDLTKDGKVPRSRVLRVCALVASGHATSVPGLHRLRAGSGGGDPYVVRAEDGARAWRCGVETNTPAAARLHYWDVGSSGVVEFSLVGPHDMTKIV